MTEPAPEDRIARAAGKAALPLMALLTRPDGGTADAIQALAVLTAAVVMSLAQAGKAEKLAAVVAAAARLEMLRMHPPEELADVVIPADLQADLEAIFGR